MQITMEKGKGLTAPPPSENLRIAQRCDHRKLLTRSLVIVADGIDCVYGLLFAVTAKKTQGGVRENKSPRDRRCHPAAASAPSRRSQAGIMCLRVCPTKMGGQMSL